MKQLNDRFEFEQRIMACWSIVDDLDIFLSQYDLEHKQVTAEQTQEYLKSLRVIYQVKFEQMFDLFEQLVQQGKIS
jgi:hypothetical protein